MRQYIIILLTLLFLSGCADTIIVTTEHEIVGFWYGLWHGMILPLAWFCSLFSDTAIYAVYNNGGWYDFGFFLGLGGLCGGASKR